MFKNKLELVKNMMQTMHITLIFMCKYRQRTFKFGFDFFQTFCMSGVIYYFLVFFKVDSGVFLHNRVATLC